VLGVLVGTATVVSLVKSGFAIELAGLPQQIFRHYASLRDAVFEPLAWALRWIGLGLPIFLRDVLVAYGLLSAAHWRAFQTERGPDIASRVGIEMMIRGSRRFGRAPKSLFFWAILWPYSFVLLKSAAKYYQSVAEDRQRFQRTVLVNLFVIFLVAVLFFAWSHVSAVYGPSPS
jgi:hypothetical protein